MRFPVRFWNSLGGVLSTGVTALALLGPWQLEPPAQLAIIAFGNAIIFTLTTLQGETEVTPLADPRLPIGSTYKATNAEGEPIVVKQVTT